MNSPCLQCIHCCRRLFRATDGHLVAFAEASISTLSHTHTLSVKFVTQPMIFAAPNFRTISRFYSFLRHRHRRSHGTETLQNRLALLSALWLNFQNDCEGSLHLYISMHRCRTRPPMTFFSIIFATDLCKGGPEMLTFDARYRTVPANSSSLPSLC